MLNNDNASSLRNMINLRFYNKNYSKQNKINKITDILDIEINTEENEGVEIVLVQ